MNNILFTGVYSATFSIYDKDMNVLKTSVQKLIDHNLQNGIQGFYVGGNTGECTVLPNRTRKQMLETVKEASKADTKLIAHVGAGRLEDVEDLIRHANAVGVDAIASLPPSLSSYYKADEIVAYYKHIAALTDKPVLAYVTPVLTCDPIWYANEIMKIDNIIGIKLSIPNYFLFEQLKQINNGNINILNGPDECMLSGLAMGADGAIGSTYNLLPDIACKIYNCFRKGEMQQALSYQKTMNRAIEALLGKNIAKWKSALKRIDIDPGYTVFPASMLTAAEEQELFAKLDAILALR